MITFFFSPQQTPTSFSVGEGPALETNHSCVVNETSVGFLYHLLQNLEGV